MQFVYYYIYFKINCSDFLDDIIDDNILINEIKM